MEALIQKEQIKRIMANCRYNEAIKEEWVQWATGDNSKTSLRSITQEQANKIIATQEGTEPTAKPVENWAKFNKNNPKHRLILSLMYQANWTSGNLPDMSRLDTFLKSDKSPVKKPLMKMTDNETEKIIKALKGIVKYRYK